MEADACPDCGAPVTGGRAGCEALFHDLTYHVLSAPALGRYQRLIVDCYAMQHVERYGRSAKSYAAHLTGLCVGVERGGDGAINEAVRRWLDGRVDLAKPEILTQRGEITIADVLAAPGIEAEVARVQEWAASIWAAYASQHDLARQWIETALRRRSAS